MAENKIQLTKADRKKVCFRHQFLQGSWNYERMQNGGWCFAMIPAIKKLYTSKDDQIAALKRHLEFYNTHPYVSVFTHLSLRSSFSRIPSANVMAVPLGASSLWI